MKRCGLLTSLTSLALALAIFPLAQAQEETAGTIGPNVSVTITVGEVEDDGSKPNRSYKMMTRSGSSAELLMGWRTPIPTATSDADGDDDGGVTSFVYQNVGMTARVEVRAVGQGTVLLRGEVEISGTREATEAYRPEGAPVIGTFQQRLDVVLKEGMKLRVAEVPDPEGGTLWLELEADVLD